MGVCMYLVEVLYWHENAFSWELSQAYTKMHFHESCHENALAYMKIIRSGTFMTPGSHENNFGDLETTYFVEVAATNSRHENRAWRLPLTKMFFSWCPIRECTFVRVGRHESFSCRFWLFPWEFHALTKSLFSGSGGGIHHTSTSFFLWKRIARISINFLRWLTNGRPSKLLGAR